MAKPNPLQEQLLKAGLAKKGKVDQIAREQAKARHGKGATVPAADEKVDAAQVQAIGKKVENIKVGDQVLFDKYSGSKLRIEDEECLILKEEDILGIFTH